MVGFHYALLSSQPVERGNMADHSANPNPGEVRALAAPLVTGLAWVSHGPELWNALIGQASLKPLWEERFIVPLGIAWVLPRGRETEQVHHST